LGEYGSKRACAWWQGERMEDRGRRSGGHVPRGSVRAKPAVHLQRKRSQVLLRQTFWSDWSCIVRRYVTSIFVRSGPGVGLVRAQSSHSAASPLVGLGRAGWFRRRYPAGWGRMGAADSVACTRFTGDSGTPLFAFLWRPDTLVPAFPASVGHNAFSSDTPSRWAKVRSVEPGSNRDRAEIGLSTPKSPAPTHIHVDLVFHVRSGIRRNGSLLRLAGWTDAL
jgi:hypothetical protein